MSAPPSSNVVSALQKYTSSLFQSLLEASRSANKVPGSIDLDIYGTNSAFKEQMKERHSRVLALINRFQRGSASDGSGSISISEMSGVVSQFEGVVDLLDDILERADMLIDEASGAGTRGIQSIIGDSSANPNTASSSSLSSLPRALPSYKPQLNFEDKPDNSYTPFVPKVSHLGERGRAVLEDFYRKQGQQHHTLPTSVTGGDGEGMGVATETGSSVGIGDSMDSVGERSLSTSTSALAGHVEAMISSEPYVHPFKRELDSLMENIERYPKHATEERPLKIFLRLESIKCTWVDTVDGLERLKRVLEGVNVFAVDLEHHNYRSFHGFVCLMQISTRDEDFLIDTIAIRSHMSLLAGVFANPLIVKVFHGMDSDVMWLQRDFGIFVVNAFDTGQAARVLEYPSFALAYLLKLLCGVTANKKYQLADWRVRPLPAEMAKYAREDTHYLLYAWDVLVNRLLEASNEDSNLLFAVLQRTARICSRVYQKPVVDPEGWMIIARKMGLLKRFDQRQIDVFQGLYWWRDMTARREDESHRYVMPNHMLTKLAQLMPTDANGVLALCIPPPPLVTANAEQIAASITATKARSQNAGGVGVSGVGREVSMSSDIEISGMIHEIVSVTSPSPNTLNPNVNDTHAIFESAKWIAKEKGKEKGKGKSRMGFELDFEMEETPVSGVEGEGEGEGQIQIQTHNELPPATAKWFSAEPRALRSKIGDVLAEWGEGGLAQISEGEGEGEGDMEDTYSRLSITRQVFEEIGIKISGEAGVDMSESGSGSESEYSQSDDSSVESDDDEDDEAHVAAEQNIPEQEKTRGEEDGVPVTYERIYEISNESRKRNRQKKRQKPTDDVSQGAAQNQIQNQNQSQTVHRSDSAIRSSAYHFVDSLNGWNVNQARGAVGDGDGEGEDEGEAMSFLASVPVFGTAGEAGRGRGRGRASQGQGFVINEPARQHQPRRTAPGGGSMRIGGRRR